MGSRRVIFRVGLASQLTVLIEAAEGRIWLRGGYLPEASEISKNGKAKSAIAQGWDISRGGARVQKIALDESYPTVGSRHSGVRLAGRYLKMHQIYSDFAFLLESGIPESPKSAKSLYILEQKS